MPVRPAQILPSVRQRVGSLPPRAQWAMLVGGYVLVLSGYAGLLVAALERPTAPTAMRVLLVALAMGAVVLLGRVYGRLIAAHRARRALRRSLGTVPVTTR